MLLIFVGIIFIAISAGLYNLRTPLPIKPSLLRLIGAGLIVVGALLSAVVQVGPGQVGVPVLFGKVAETSLPSGLHLINPLATAHYFDIKTQNYTMSAVHDEGDRSGDDAIRVLSSDGLEVSMDITVLYRLIPTEVPRLMRETGDGYRDIIVRPLTRTKIRDNAVYYSAVDMYSNKREEYQNRVFTAIEKDFKARGLLLEQLLVRNISLPESVKVAIEAKINAEQEAQKMQFVLDKERQEAERKRVEAQGIADYQRIMSAQLSDKQLQYEMIKAYNNLAQSPNTKVLIMGNGKSPVILDAK